MGNGTCLVEPDLAEDPIIDELRRSPVRGPAWLPGPALMGVLAGMSMFRVRAFTEVGGFSPPWVLRERRVVPPQVERNLLRLEESQRRSTARRYVG